MEPSLAREAAENGQKVWEMVQEEFLPKEVWEKYRPFSEVMFGRLLGTLFEDVTKFLNKSGIKASIEGFTSYGGEPPSGAAA